MPSNQEFALTPLGALSILPRELRDEIYRHIHHHKYYLPPFPRAPRHPRFKWRSFDNVVPSLSLLAVSKSLRHEFLALLHAEGEFIMSEPELGKRFSPAWTRNAIPFINQIQNVKFLTTVEEWFYIANGADFSSAEYYTLLHTDAEAIPFFTGTEIVRKTCVVDFLRPWTPRMIQMLQSPFFEVLKNLTGFATVVLKVFSHKTHWQARDAVDYVQEGSLSINHPVGFRVIVDAMSSVLEPTLGPSVINLDNRSKRVHGEWRITFHPQSFNTKKKDIDTCSTLQGKEIKEGLSPLENS